MKRLIKVVSVAILFVTLTACSGDTVKGNGKAGTSLRNLAAFSHVDISGKFNVLITAGVPQKVRVTADSNLLNYIVTKVQGNTLYIMPKKDVSIKTTSTPSISVHVKTLAGLKTSGSVKVRAGDIISKSLQVSTSGMSKIELIGKVDDLNINTRGTAMINSVALPADNVSVDISGMGKVNVKADNSLKVKISGSGEVKYAGNPKITQQVSGVGKILQLDKNAKAAAN